MNLDCLRRQWRAAALLLASTLMAAAPAYASQWISGSYGNAYGGRFFNAFIPTSYQAGTPMPMVVALHGCTQDPVTLAGASRYNDVAESQGFIVLYPDQALAANPAQCWNVQFAVNQVRGAGEPSIIQGMVDWMKSRYSINAKKVYVSGFSAGGAMASILLSCYPDVYAAGAVHSGTMYSSALSSAGLAYTLLNGSGYNPNTKGYDAYRCGGSRRLLRPVVVFHGSQDNIVNPINGSQVIAQFAQTNDYSDDGANNDSIRNVITSQTNAQVPGGRMYTVDNYFYAGKMLMQQYRIYSMNHTWSGGNPAFPYADPSGPDATAIQWNFFKGFSR